MAEAATIDALKLSYGGISYIANLFGCSRDTIRVGINELCQEGKKIERRVAVES